MPETIKIGNRLIGKGQPVFIIAEVGVDHKGDIPKAKKLIDEAKKSGADAIKFQTYHADKLVTPEAKVYWHLSPGDLPHLRQIDTFGNLDKLPRDIYTELIEYGKQKGLIVFSTPFDEDAVDVLVRAGMQAIKIASGDLTCHPLLKKAAQTKLPILLSTGASTHEEIDEALRVIKENGNPQVALMHCILDYPTDENHANLRAIQAYAQKYNVPIGFSDHTLTVPAGPIAVYYGVSFLEKHCTGEKFEAEEGKPINPDASFMSMEEFSKYVREIRRFEKGEINLEMIKLWAKDKIEEMSGIKNPKRPLQCELPAWQQARRSLISTRTIKKGEPIRLSDLTWKRPGTGFDPTLKNISYLIGRKSIQTIPANSIILPWMIDNS